MYSEKNVIQNEKDITIAITAASYSGNKGAAAMLQSSIKQLYKHYGNGLNIKLMSVYPNEDEQQKPFDFIEIIPAQPEKILFIAFPLAVLYFLLGWISPIGLLLRKNKIINAYYQTDAVIDEAGISFVDSRGFIMNTYALVTVLIPILCGIPVYKYSQALGTFKKIYNRVYAKFILSKIKIICARGEITKENLYSIGIKKNVQVVADGAFSMDDDEKVMQEIDTIVNNDNKFFNNNVVSVSISSVVKNKCSKLGINYKEIMIEFINYLTSNQYHVLLIANAARIDSQKEHNNDLIICQSVYDKCIKKDKIRWYNEEMSAEKIRELIGKTRFLVASRFHAMIGALYKKVPVLLIGWSHKYKEVLDMFELGNCSIDFTNLSTEKLILQFEDLIKKEEMIKEKIIRHLDDVKKSSQNNIQIIVNDINTFNLKPKNDMFDMSNTSQYIGHNITCRMGYTNDDEIAGNCASGGLVTSVLCNMLENGIIDGAWVTKSEVNNGNLDYKTFIATTKEEIISCGGSVYMHIPLLKHINIVEEFQGKLAVVMLPCQLKAFKQILEKKPDIQKKIICKIGLLCSGSHNIEATTLPLKKLGYSLKNAKNFYYRMGFWRGKTIIEYKDGNQVSFSYTKSISAYKNAYFFTRSACMICQEHYANESDLSFGDIWLKEMKRKNRKYSSCIIRTDIGKKIYDNTVAADLIHDEYISRRKIILSQKRALAFKFLCAYVKRNTLQKKGRNVKLKCTYNNKWNYKLAWYLAHKNQQYSLKHPDKIEKIPLSIVYVYMLFIRFLLSF